MKGRSTGCNIGRARTDKRNQPPPEWDLKQEREHEAKNPGPQIKLEVINVTSVETNERAIWEREAHVQLILETLVPPHVVGKYQKQAKEYHKVFEVGPLDPEQHKAAAGVGIAAAEGLKPYRLPNPTEDMKDAEATGRCSIFCIDLAGQI